MVQAGCIDYDDNIVFTTETFNGSVWRNDSSMIHTRNNHVGIGNIYDTLVNGGYDIDYTRTKTTERYNGSSWYFAAENNYNRDSHAIIGIANSCMIQGGTTAILLKSTETFNGSVWNNDSAKLNINRYDHSATGIINNCMVQCNYERSTTTEIFNGSVWSMGSDVVQGRSYHTATGTSTICSIHGGVVFSSTFPSIENYNNYTWSLASVYLLNARDNHSACGTSNSFMVQGGTNNSSIKTTEKYLS